MPFSIGYDNEEIVNVSSLQPSLGKNAIKEQIEISQMDKISTNEEQIGDHEITCEDVILSFINRISITFDRVSYSLLIFQFNFFKGELEDWYGLSSSV